MTLPLAILAFFAITLGVIGTPAGRGSTHFSKAAPPRSVCTALPSRACCADVTSSLVVFLGLGLGWRLYGDKSPKPEAPDALEKAAPWLWAGLRDRLYVDEFYGVTVIAFYAWWARVADWLDRRVGAASWPWSRGSSASGRSSTACSTSTGSMAASTKPAKSFPRAAACWRGGERPRAELPSHSCCGRRRAGRNSSLEQPAMNVIATGFPILTLLTVLPLVGAAIALFAGRHARSVAVFTTLACLVVSLFIWMHLPGDGSIGLVERAAWAPSLGIEYHLGVDGLGALMLVLAAIVTLMSVDASHRVHHMPGLYFGLVLTLEAGLFGSFTALNFFHWFLFWELSLIPAFFLIKLWGGPRRGPAATQFFIYTMAGSVALSST